MKRYLTNLAVLAVVAIAAAVTGNLIHDAQAQSNRESVIYASKTWDPGSAASGGQVTTTITVATAVLGDWCQSSLGVSTGGLVITCAVTAANTVTVTLLNNSGGAVDLASSLLRVRVVSHPPYLR